MLKGINDALYEIIARKHIDKQLLSNYTHILLRVVATLTDHALTKIFITLEPIAARVHNDEAPCIIVSRDLSNLDTLKAWGCSILSEANRGCY